MSYPNFPPPTCVTGPRDPLVPGISDHTLATILPTLAYAVASVIFHIIGQLDLLNRYRIHPSKEELQRNHVSKFRCLLGVIRYHAMQIVVGMFLSYNAEPEMIGNEACEIHSLEGLISRLRKTVPLGLAVFGLDSKGIAAVIQKLPKPLPSIHSSGFTPIEMFFAHVLVSLVVPAMRFFVALAIVDTWIYFTHRLCHINKTLYRIVHAQHHQLYVSYAFGAVYAHWLESFFLDIVSFLLANYISGMTVRQSMLFSSLATWKTISDHCGYVFPWDPFSYVNGNGARFHDLHHQSWGLKHNFSTYTVFWDKLLGTSWENEDEASRRYSRTRRAVQERAEKSPHQDATRSRKHL